MFTETVVNLCALEDRDSGRLQEKLERRTYCFWRRSNQEKKLAFARKKY